MNQDLKLVQEAKDYYNAVSLNEILDAKQTKKNLVRLKVFNNTFKSEGVIWIAFSEDTMYLRSEVGTHSARRRKK